jgi:uncharacterized protein YbjT (DUF2867 family)
MVRDLEVLPNKRAGFCVVTGAFGDGDYRLQPIFVDDFARLAVEAAGAEENLIRDSIGPETFTYRELVKAIGEAIGRGDLL